MRGKAYRPKTAPAARSTGSGGAGGRILSGLILLVIGLLGLFNNFLDIQNEMKLREQGQTIMATVANASLRTRYLVFKRHEVDYRFQLGGQMYWYDSSILRNYHNWTNSQDRKPPSLNAEVPEQNWNRARAAKAIQVVYLPSNPWINRPVAATNPLLGLSIPHVLGALLLLVVAITGLGMIADALSRLVAA